MCKRLIVFQTFLLPANENIIMKNEMNLLPDPLLNIKT